MAKYGHYRKVHFAMSLTSSRGRYKIEADYHRTHVVTYTNDSEVYDYLDDEDHPKEQKEARIYCYNKIRFAEEWKNLK